MAASEGAHRRPTAHMATTTLKVDGMTCGACTSAVEAGFKDLEGVGNVSVSLMMGRAVVHHDPAIVPAEQVAEIIEDRGFDAQVLSTDTPQALIDQSDATASNLTTVSTTTLTVGGMTCGACTSSVEAGFKDVEGVKSVNVSLLSERAVVEHDPSIITAEQVAEIIEDRGFDAAVVSTKTSDSSTKSGPSNCDITKRLTTTTVSVGGMTCGACTAAVENTFKDAAGLETFNISLLAERAILTHDPSILSPEKIAEMIEDAGFDASIVSSEMVTRSSSSTTTVSLSIYGLSNAVAAASLEERLREVPGVITATVSATSRAQITYTTATVGIRALVEVIDKAGFDALLDQSADNNAQLESLAKTKEIREWRRAFLISLSFAIPVFIIGMALPMWLPSLNFGAFQLIPGLFLGDIICLVLTLPVQFGIGMRFYRSAYKSLKHRSPTMDVLVTLGTSAAFFFSVFAMVVAILSEGHEKPSTIFDTSTMLITFITLGRYLENHAKGRTSRALSELMSLTPSMATIYEDPIAAEKAAEGWDHPDLLGADEKKKSPEAQSKASSLKHIPTEFIQVGDIVLLRPGDRIPADGTVVRGESYVEESMVTGEAIPISKTKGSLVMAGTVNGSGSLDFRVTRAGRDTQLSQIVQLVQEAQTNRAPIQRIADVVAGYFVPIIISLGLITFLGWLIVSHIMPHPPKIFLDEKNGGKFMVCLKLCISVIVFACPCALGLSTPTAIMVGTGVGTRLGIIFKSGVALEEATKISHVVFDKTGTLTIGKMSVADAKIEPTWSANEWRRQLWWLIVGLAEMGSEHPIGRSILIKAKEEMGISAEDALDGQVGDFEATVGKGIAAVVEPASSVERTRYRIMVGNATFLQDRGVALPAYADPEVQKSSDAGSRLSVPAPSGPLASATHIHIAIDNQYAGTLALQDSVKPTAKAAVAALHRMGISTSIVTGDTYSTALAVAYAVGIPPSAIHASVAPSEKQSIVTALKTEGGEIVAMVGDGINDSPALATASVGIALSSGTDVAVEAADIVLKRSEDLLSVPASICLSRTIFTRIKLNLLWATMYNFIGLPFAMGLFLPLGDRYKLHPMAAGLCMIASSLTVLASSLLLDLWRRPRWMTVEKLENEVDTGRIYPVGEVGGKLKGRGSSWWKRSPVTTTTVGAGGVLGFARRVGDSVLSRIPGYRPSGGLREDEGYVPLQTMESVV